MKGKAIIITGANGAIGSFLTAEYLKRGCLVFALIHNHKDRISPLIDKFPDKLVVKECDLTNYDVVKSVFREFIDQFGFIPRKLIHTSAVRSSDFSILTNTDPKRWYSIVQMNIFSCYNLLHIILPFYQKDRVGKIVLIGSNISRTGLKNGSAYAVAKGALANLARTIALEYGQDNILINVLSPGAVQADQSHFDQDYRRFREDYFQKELKNTPLRKLVQPIDILNSCDFLLSDKNNLISGEEIFITGGKI